MKLPKLFRRYTLVLPTLSGWLLLVLVLGLVVTVVFRNAALFLIVNQPVAADYLVIEAWMEKEELEQAQAFFDSNDYQLAILVGGPIGNDFHGIDSNYARRAADYLRVKGLPEDKMAVVEAPYSAQDRTFLNAVYVREWMLEQDGKLSNIDVFSSPAHTRRSRELYQTALGENVEVGVVPSNPSNFDPVHWWRTSESGRYVVSEFAGWLLVQCCFRPGEPGSHLEKWGVPGDGGN
jgi:uncharacterized SAM-binding protein YcdF (DUF218 family)